MFRRAVCGLVAAGLLVGGVAWVRASKTVTLEVDTAARRVHTYATTVGGVLDRLGLTVGEHDILAPKADVHVHDGTRIVVRRGRLLHLRVNGRPRDVWVTALSVDEALDQLGFLDERSFVSASRSRRIGLEGTEVSLRLPARVRILADGKVRTVVTTAPTVRSLLRSQHIRLGRHDLIRPRPDAYPRNGTVVRINRVRGAIEDELALIPHRVLRRPDSSMYQGETRVVVQGADGLLRRRYGLVFKDGRLVSRALKQRTVVRPPKTGVVAYGTRVRPYNVGGPADNLNWWALARCESGGNPRSVGGGGAYRGLYQFSWASWRYVGGRGDPIDASPQEQTYRAKLLYLRRGTSPWPSCGRYLYR